MKYLYIFLLFCCLTVKLFGQHAYGTTGLLFAPTAEMQKDKTIMIGSIATPDDAWLFQEAIVVSEMQELLALQKQILEMKTSLTSSLSNLVAANKALDPASPHFNKYSAESFSALC